jgi:hypothetical protein
MLNLHFPESVGTLNVIARVVIASEDLAFPERPGLRRQRSIRVKRKLLRLDIPTSSLRRWDLFVAPMVEGNMYKESQQWQPMKINVLEA